jgi:hypothetical protein
MLVEGEMKNAESSAIWSQLKKISHGVWAVVKISGENFDSGEIFGERTIGSGIDLVFLVVLSPKAKLPR